LTLPKTLPRKENSRRFGGAEGASTQLINKKFLWKPFLKASLPHKGVPRLVEAHGDFLSCGTSRREMSALPLKADTLSVGIDVRFVPTADMPTPTV
jgi:hypothetical protein